MREYTFADFVAQHSPLPSDQLERLLEGSRELKLERKELVLAAGDLCHHCFYIERGAVREYSLSPDGREHLLHFATEGWFIMNVESVFFSQPSSYFVETIEPSRLLLIDNECMKQLSAEEPSFGQFTRGLLYEHIRMLQERITSLQSLSAEERYLRFVAYYPEAMQRIPQMMIASYLGITPESLSRIRRTLAKGKP